jgi:alkylhydroperoxidase family enzyme
MTGDPRELRPPIAAAYAETVATVLEGGIVDRSLKELCFRSLAGEDVSWVDERERAALDWAYAIEWDADAADDDLWDRLHAHFSDPELVELGYAIAFKLGQLHWERTFRSPSPGT